MLVEAGIESSIGRYLTLIFTGTNRLIMFFFFIPLSYGYSLSKF